MNASTQHNEALHADLLDINANIAREKRRERERYAASRQYRVRCAIERFRENLQLQNAIGDDWFDV